MRIDARALLIVLVVMFLLALLHLILFGPIDRTSALVGTIAGLVWGKTDPVR